MRRAGRAGSTARPAAELGPSFPWRLAAALAAVLGCAGDAPAGHELPFYPGYYPQEIRVETVALGAAPRLLGKSAIHAYVGGDPLAAKPAAADLGSAESLSGYLVLSVNPASSALATREARCAGVERIAASLPAAGVFVLHRYPVTPYDGDYLYHFDVIQSRAKAARPYGAADSIAGVKIRAKGALAEKLLGGRAAAAGGAWDAVLEEVSLDELVGAGRIALNGGFGAPWLKSGWFHAYLLHSAALADFERQAARALYDRLVAGGYGDLAEAANLGRALVGRLVAGCERAVVGYTLRRERYSAEFSEGVENVAWDSQSGLNSAAFIRTVKLKDFPWNGWLRLGIASKAAAAWNPVAGFSDPAGRLIWAALGDPAMLPAPFGAGWVDNRVVPASVTADPAGVPVPEDVLVPEPGTGNLREVGKGRTAKAVITYRVRASAFHDNTRMTAADAVYAYVFAARWGGRAPGGADPDAAVEAGTALARRALVGFKVARVESEVKKWGDMAFTYAIPVVDVYLDAAGDPAQLAALAPPWSPVPWHVLALMEEAAKRGLGAFSAEEARRRNVRWLDLARDVKLRDALVPILDGLVREAHVPEALRGFATADEAQTRWTALREFQRRRGHLLVTAGPYRLARWSDASATLEVFRDFSNPMGVGSFDRFAIPRRAYAARVSQRGDRLEIQPEIERAEKFLRTYRIVREPLGSASADESAADVPACRYVLVDADGAVVAAGMSRDVQGNRLIVAPRGRLRPGAYTALLALSLADNDVAPEIATATYRVDGGSS